MKQNKKNSLKTYIIWLHDLYNIREYYALHNLMITYDNNFGQSQERRFVPHSTISIINHLI